MAVHIVRLGTPRGRNEGPRLGTVRRPPRGVPRAKWATGNYYDVWFPVLAPSEPVVKLGLAAKTDQQLRAYQRRYLAEMKRPDARHVLDALAVLSRTANFAVGCYCEDESRCHRSLLKQLLAERGADIYSP